MGRGLIRTLLAVGIIVGTVYLTVFSYAHVPLQSGFFHTPSLILVTGLLTGIALLLCDLVDVGRFLRFLFGYSATHARQRAHVSEGRAAQMLDIMLDQGPKALRKYVQDAKLPRVWALAAAKLEARIPTQDVKTLLEQRARRTLAVLDQDALVLRQLAALAPAVGMLGSVLGLIRLLTSMSDFESLGPNMALALVTTLYGILIGNVVFVPLARRVERRRYIAQRNHQTISSWLKWYEEGKPSLYLKTDLGREQKA